MDNFYYLRALFLGLIVLLKLVLLFDLKRPVKLIEAAGTAEVFDLINGLDRAATSRHQLFDTLNKKGEIGPDLPRLV